jgi:O-antigen/teichoic acid export membrane protein
MTGIVRRLVGSEDRRLAFENLLFRIIALVAMGAATVLIARVSGPAAVGHYALLRVLPWLAAMILTAGYEGAIVYHLARARGPAPGVRSTILAILAIGAAVGATLWFASAPLLVDGLLDGLPAQLVRIAALLVPTRLCVAVGRQCLQGTRDLRGSNINIALEAAAFLPLFTVALGAGTPVSVALVGALIGADVMTLSLSWTRLARNGFFRDTAPPSIERAKQLLSFGVRTNSGYLLQLLNLRFDVVLIGSIAGATTVGTYAIASRFAELILLVPHSIMYVLQPRYTGMDRAAAAEAARRVVRPALGLTALAAAPIAAGAEFVLPLVYGEAFTSAVRPTQILLIGLIATGAASAMTAYLYGDGRPGLVSIATGVGFTAMVLLDVALIPRLGAVGAALASSLSYTASAIVVWLCFRVVARRPAHPTRAHTDPEPARAMTSNR